MDSFVLEKDAAPLVVSLSLSASEMDRIINAGEVIDVHYSKLFKRLVGRKRHPSVPTNTSVSAVLPLPAMPSSSSSLSLPMAPSNRFDSLIDQLERKYLALSSFEALSDNDKDDSDDDDDVVDPSHSLAISATPSPAKKKRKSDKRAAAQREDYDYSDPFIDDSDAADAMQQVLAAKKMKTVHEGFFVSTGRLEVVRAAPKPPNDKEKEKEKEKEKNKEKEVEKEKNKSKDQEKEKEKGKDKEREKHKDKDGERAKAKEKEKDKEKEPVSSSSLPSDTATAAPSKKEKERDRESIMQKAQALKSKTFEGVSADEPPAKKRERDSREKREKEKEKEKEREKATPSDAIIDAVLAAASSTTTAPAAVAPSRSANDALPAAPPSDSPPPDALSAKKEKVVVEKPDWCPSAAVQVAMGAFKSAIEQSGVAVSKRGVTLPVEWDAALLALDKVVLDNHTHRELSRTKGYHEFVQSVFGPQFPLGRIKSLIARLHLAEKAKFCKIRLDEAVDKVKNDISANIVPCPESKQPGAKAAKKATKTDKEDMEIEELPADELSALDAPLPLPSEEKKDDDAAAALLMKRYAWFCKWSIPLRQQLNVVENLVDEWVSLENKFREKLSITEKKEKSEEETKILDATEEQQRVFDWIGLVFPESCLQGDVVSMKKSSKLERARQTKAAADAKDKLEKEKQEKVLQKEKEKAVSVNTPATSLLEKVQQSANAALTK